MSEHEEALVLKTERSGESFLKLHVLTCLEKGQHLPRARPV